MERRERRKKRITIQKTEVYLSITKFCEEVHREVTMGMVHGGSGLGKTTALKAYNAKNAASVVYYEVPDDTVSRKSLLEDILETLGGFSANKSIAALKKQIVRQLLEKGVELLIIDQANYIKAGSFNMLNAIRESSDIGLIFAGTDKLPHNIQSACKSMELEQFYSRVEFTLPLLELSKRVIGLFLVGLGTPKPGEGCAAEEFNRIVDFVFEKSRFKGSLRTATNMYDRARQLCNLRGDGALSFEHFELACKHVL